MQGAFELMGVEYVKKAQEEKVDLSNITPEQHERGRINGDPSV